MRTIYVYDYKNYKVGGTVGVRPSVRAIIIKDGKLGMIHSRRFDYYTFAGGGIDPGESHEEALIREVREELGLKVLPETIREYGLLIRKEKGKIDDLFIQENYYYLCEVSDQQMEQELEGYEIIEDYEVCWVTPEIAIRVNQDHDHGEMGSGPTQAEYMHHLFHRDEVLMRKLVEEGLVPAGEPAENG